GRTTVNVTVVRADGKEASKTWSFIVGKAQYELYFGQLHSHTTYSDGSGSLESALAYIAGLPESANVDFVAFTDHSNYFDGSSAGTTANPEGALYDMSLASSVSQGLWNTYKNTIAEFNASQGEVIAIGGFEMTWSGGPGHMNTFNTPGIVSRNNTTLNNKTADAGMKAYYALLSQSEGADSISQFNHPGATFGTFSDFAYWDALIDSRIHLVEVGNGEGQVGAGGYFPSYEYYTMALDKGWHVAPTNNQDNHKGKWGNANEARDVVLTDNFTEEGLYDAMRAMRMYSTEDKNLEIGYTVNGMLLGSSIEEVPEKLNIEVTVYDPDKSDSISKVEVIVNSGKVAHVWDNPAELATGTLSVELAPEYSYYYIRVTEGDGDLAVTAPVWVGESLKLGISSVDTTTATPVTGEELTITTTLFNSEDSEATVKSLVYTTEGGKVIGTDLNTYVIPASASQSVSFAFTPEAAKVTKITVTAVVELEGVEYTFTMDIELDVQDADKLVYIGIDASHYNEYVNGNYKDSMGNFSLLASEYNVRTVTLYS
ncbi:MAG: CehA/McbA family metallohydrolase, partial [Oscillospiraceae bacterium]|nr:CehA/McbA family metallohydrolase [Oscillospiraceae bacterium]